MQPPTPHCSKAGPPPRATKCNGHNGRDRRAGKGGSTVSGCGAWGGGDSSCTAVGCEAIKSDADRKEPREVVEVTVEVVEALEKTAELARVSAFDSPRTCDSLSTETSTQLRA